MRLVWRSLLLLMCSTAIASPLCLAQSSAPAGTPDPQNSAPNPPQTSTGASPQQVSPVDEPVLEQADEEQLVPFMESRIVLKYDHIRFEPNGSINRGRIYWLQAFGDRQRLAASIELPFVGLDTPIPSANATGFGDVKVAFRGILGKSALFEHGAEIEFTFPTASDRGLGLNQTIFRGLWGFSRSITGSTLLSGNLAYNKAVQTDHGYTGENSFEPELILTQALSKRIAVFADYDLYYSFNQSQLGQTMKFGVVWVFGPGQTWDLSPYAQLPLNQFTRRTNLNSDVGIDFSYHF